MKALIDGDILRYEIGFAAETGWKAITEREEVPPFEYVEDLLKQRIAAIQAATTCDKYYLYLTEGRTFRHDIAVTKPYKGQRIPNKPWHYKNLTAYMTGVLPCFVVNNGLEADDAMAIDHVANPQTTIICSRDKDLRQVPGYFFSWELGKQPAFGPVDIGRVGTLSLSADNKSLKGTGYAFFAAQMLMGDRVDNIPGLDGVGPLNAFRTLEGCVTCEDYEKAVEETYKEAGYGEGFRLVEQGQLLWVVRRLDAEGKPVLFKKGVYE